jgi:hypothetical protein
MTNKKLLMLASAAVALGVTAYVTSSGRKVKTPALNGRSVVEAFNAADVAKVEISGKDKLTLVAGDKGWTVASCHGYPADVAKIRENILKLTDLKVGQVARGRKIASPSKVELKGAGGKTLAALDGTGQPTVVNVAASVAEGIASKGSMNNASSSSSVTAGSYDLAAANVPRPRVTGIEIVGANVVVTVKDTVPFVGYTLQSGDDVTNFSVPAGASSASGNAAGEIKLITPKKDGAQFFKVSTIQ